MLSYKYKIRRPSKRVVACFEQTLSICCELYNAALQERRDAWKVARKSVSRYDQQNQLPEIREERADVASVYAQVLQAALCRVDRTFQSFFRRVKAGEKAGYPRFKSIKRFDSFTYPQLGFKIENDKLHLSKVGSVKLHLSRPIEGKIKTCTIKREVSGWFVIFSVEENQCSHIPKTGESVGVDVGLENFATLSTGEAIANPELLHKAESKIKTLQRAVSRKRRGSQRRKKAVRSLAKAHLKVKRQRLDFCHKTSLDLIRRFDEIAVEDLNIKGMVKNHHLAKSINDAAWGTFLSVLECKAENAGRRVWKVPVHHTSQDCSGCGERVKKTLSQREHQCPHCGLNLHRDHNAAINISGRAVRSGMARVTSPCEPRIHV
jgi:putative transposase